MLSTTEMQAYAQKINLTLFNEILAFIMDTAKADKELQRDIRHSCIFSDINCDPGAVQTKTGFLYLGELLERYEERFGMPDAELRAIALALGFANDFLADNMFVDSQKEDFLTKVRVCAEDDIFLTGALYLLEGSPWKKNIWDRTYALTEDIIFALSLFPDHNKAFDHFRPQLLRLLGKERTVPVLGNAKFLDWFAARLIPEMKQHNGKDMALFRALCALPRSFVKLGSKTYEILSANGYTPLEIAYANMMAVQSQEADGVLSLSSVVTEKAAVHLFEEVLSTEETIPEKTYRYLTELFHAYKKFHIKCYGTHELLSALEERTELKTPDAFIWLASIVDVSSPLFRCFDVLDSKWDRLAREMPTEQYREVFCQHLSEDMDAGNIISRIARYDALTGISYVEHYYEKENANGFDLLVEKGVVDLWQAFSSSLDEEGNVVKPGMLKNMTYCFNHKFTLQGFHFFEKFLEHYNVPDLHRFFSDYNHCFDRVAKCDYQKNIHINFNWDFLDDGMRRQLLSWVQEDFYLRYSDKYTMFLETLLVNETAAKVLSWQEQRAIFDLLLEQKQLSDVYADALKKRYYTPEEMEAEQKALDVERQERERMEEAQRQREFNEEYAKTENDFGKIRKFIDNNRYYQKDRLTASNIVYEHLDAALAATGHTLDKPSLAAFLYICGELAALDVLDIAQVQIYINKMKEGITCDEDKAC